MLADENTTVAVIFTDDAGNRTTYDCSTPTNCFAAFLEKFLEAHKSGQFKNQDQDSVKKVLGFLDEDCYNAGKEAFFFIRRTSCIGYYFKKIK
jgi:hypothetical protein